MRSLGEGAGQGSGAHRTSAGSHRALSALAWPPALHRCAWVAAGFAQVRVGGCGCACSPACAPGLQLQQMKELEEEKEVLLRGLEMMARGRDWYQRQLEQLQERQCRLGRGRAVSAPGSLTEVGGTWGWPTTLTIPPPPPSRTLGLQGVPAPWGSCCPRRRRWCDAWGSCWPPPVWAG